MKMKQSDKIEITNELSRISKGFENMSKATIRVLDYMNSHLESKEKFNKTYLDVKNVYSKLIIAAEQFLNSGNDIDANEFENICKAYNESLSIHEYHVCKKLAEISIRDVECKYKSNYRESLPQFKNK
jgi:hypothetical protein